MNPVVIYATEFSASHFTAEDIMAAAKDVLERRVQAEGVLAMLLNVEQLTWQYITDPGVHMMMGIIHKNNVVGSIER